MTPLQLLEVEMMAYKQSRFPNVPTHAIVRPKYNDSTANGLTSAIRDKLRIDGHFIARINTQGNYRESVGKWTKSTSTNGMSDLVACINGHFVAIEIKAGKDRQSDAQKQVQKTIELSGGSYVIARTYSGFIDWYRHLKNKEEIPNG